MKKTRSLSTEQLVARDMMAADFNLTGGVLNINGTSARDFVQITGVNGSTIRVDVEGRQGAEFPQADVRAVKVNLGGGNDVLEINRPRTNYLPHGFNNVAAIDIVYGGNADVWLRNASATQSASITAAPTAGRLFAVVEFLALQSLQVNTSNRNVNDEIFIEYSNIADSRLSTNGGNDYVEYRFSDLGRTAARTGTGNDSVFVRDSTIRDARMHLGRGDDRVTLSAATIQGGRIDGGNGDDEAWNVRNMRRVFRSFRFVS